MVAMTKLHIGKQQQMIAGYGKSIFPPGNLCRVHIIRASVDALCRDGAGEISRDRLQRGRLTRQGTTSLASKAHRYDSQTHL